MGLYRLSINFSSKIHYQSVDLFIDSIAAKSILFSTSSLGITYKCVFNLSTPVNALI